MSTRVPRLALSLALVVLLSASAWAQTPAPPRRRRPARSSSSRRRRASSSSRPIPAEAPKTVARILELVKARFYNGMRVHRVVPGLRRSRWATRRRVT